MRIKKKVIIVDIIWIASTVLLLYLGIWIDIGIAFILGLFYFVASYALSGISSYGGGNPYRGMVLSSQPNEIEYSTYKMEYEMRRKKYAGRVNWFILSIGSITFFVLLILLLTSRL